MGRNDGADRPELAGFAAAARRAFVLAEQEARSLGHDRIGTEHLLVGLLANERGAAAQILRDAGATLAAVRHKVAETPAVQHMPPDGEPLPLTPRANRALVRAVRFSHQRQVEEVGTAHLLLGVVDVEGTAALILRRLGVEGDGFEAAATIDDATAATAPQSPTRTAVQGPADLDTAHCPSCGEVLELAYTIVPAQGPAGDRDVALFRCARCGQVIGVSAARAQGGANPSPTGLS